MSFLTRHPRVTLAVVVPTLLVATDLGFTAAYRTLAGGRASGEPRLRVRSEVFHHGFAPNVSVLAEHWGPRACPYRTNSLGFRDAVVRDVPLVASNRRVLFMGDSFTEGVGVPWDQTFVGLTAAALGPGGVEVLNGAVSLYSPTIYERKTRFLLDDVGLRFDELVVFIDISDVLDETAYHLDARDHVVLDGPVRRNAERAAERWSRGRTTGAAQALGRFLDQHTLLLARAYDAFAARAESPLHYGAAWTFDAGAMAEYGRAGLARARERMDALATLVRSRGIRLTIAVYPWPDQVLMHDRASLQVRFWRAWADEHGVALLDYFPLFLTGVPADVVRRDYIPGDVHWNESGHRLVAGPLIAQLRTARR